MANIRSELEGAPTQASLLLIAHGSRRKEANDDLDYLAEQLRRKCRWDCVQTSFLEQSQPTIQEGGALCVAQGACRVIMLPYILSSGMHVRDDLTAARDELVKRFPHVDFVLAEPLGRHPLLVEVVVQRADEAMPGA